MMAVLIAGSICVVLALARLPIEKIDFHFLLLFCFTIGIGSRMTVQIPRFKAYIAVSDIFIFLALLIYGGEFAVILSAVEAFFSSRKFCNKTITVLFNAAAMALSTTAVVLALNLFGLYSESQLHGRGDSLKDFIVVLSVIALTQFIANTFLASIHDSLKNAIPLWETWKSKYIWSFITFFVGSVGAGILVQLSDSVGSGVIIATFPVIVFVFLAYRMYLRNVEISMQHAEQAEKYAGILEEQASALRISEERFRSAFNYAPIGIALVSSSGNWLKVNLALCGILGYTEKELLSMDFQSIIFPDDLGITLIKIHEVISGKCASWQMEHRYVHKSGRTVWASWSVSSASDTRSEHPNLIFQIQDITDKKQAEEKLQHDATHDALTGLPNRALFMGRLTEALRKRRHGSSHKVSVLFIDLDRFKYVNDSLGHLIGDRLLVGISERLRECMRPTDMVARLGGDEFVILVEGTYDISEVIRIAERIQQKFSMPFDLSGHEVYSSASIGILHASDKHDSAEDMMRDADTAMYQAKRAGKARHEVFDEKMHKAVKETLQLETDMRRAVERKEFSVAYQPVYSLATGKIECVEALARWTHPELGEISPSKFIPLADEIGMIGALSEQIIRMACLQIGEIKQANPERASMSLSINLSCRQFGQPDLVEKIKSILDETGFAPTDLKLEITESVFFEYPEKAVEMLDQLRELGIELNVDDFGTGYSNLSYLMRLPISTLKIYRSFTRMIDQTGNNLEVVQAIVMLARNLGLKVIAEGVETETQLDELRRLHCDGAQGFLFAKPMTFENVRNFLAADDNIGVTRSNLNDVSMLSVIQ